MRSKNMSKKKTVGVQVTKDEYDRIESLANAETRTISSYLRHVLYTQNILPRCSATKQPAKADRRRVALA